MVVQTKPKYPANFVWTEKNIFHSHYLYRDGHVSAVFGYSKALFTPDADTISFATVRTLSSFRRLI